MSEPGRGFEPRQESPAATATLRLLTLANAGDAGALNELFARYGPELTRFAHGRLPRWARRLSDTPDLVQDTLLQTFTHLERFEWRGEGALRAYMRLAVTNRIRDELRKAARRPAEVPIDGEAPGAGPSPLELAIGRQGVERYEAALGRLTPDDRDAIVARVELGMSYAEIAEATGRSTPNAARMAVVRALLRLSEEMQDGGSTP